MGADHDEIERIARHPRLTDDERRWQIGARRASAAGRAVRRNGVPVTFDLDGYVVHVDGVTVAGDRVALHGLGAARDGRSIVVDEDDEVVIVNPPLLVPDPDGDVNRGDRGRFREDPGAIILAVLLDLIRRADQ